MAFARQRHGMLRRCLQCGCLLGFAIELPLTRDNVVGDAGQKEK